MGLWEEVEPRGMLPILTVSVIYSYADVGNRWLVTLFLSSSLVLSIRIVYVPIPFGVV